MYRKLERSSRSVKGVHIEGGSIEIKGLLILSGDKVFVGKTFEMQRLVFVLVAHVFSSLWSGYGRLVGSGYRGAVYGNVVRISDGQRCFKI